MDAREMNAYAYLNGDKFKPDAYKKASKDERDFWKRIQQKALDFLDML